MQTLLREHVVVTLFLTMLVGAGGNAGNQSAIKVQWNMVTTGHYVIYPPRYTPPPPPRVEV